MTALRHSTGRAGASLKTRQWSVVIMSTLAFTVCFAIWMMFAVIGIPIKKMLDLNATQFGLLTATPVLTGSLIRVPLGMWTDKYGGRIVFFLLMPAPRSPSSSLPCCWWPTAGPWCLRSMQCRCW
jgi:nitrate/nitrite transporter NarK